MTAGRGIEPFLIVGGGIGGLTAALALALKGFRVRALEQAPAFAEIGAGIQLGPNVFHALRRLGLHDLVLADAWAPETMEMRDALSAELVTRIPLNTEMFRARFQEPYAVTHRADLHQVILDACLNNSLITLENNKQVESVADNGNSVTATMTDGTVVAGSGVIGADGLWSRIRDHLLGDGPPRVSGHIAFRAVLPRAEVPDDLWSPNVVLWAGPRTHLVHYPLRRGTLFNLVAVFHSDKYVEGWNAEGDVAELFTQLNGQRPEVLRLLEKIETWRMWVLCDREPVKTWSRGRVALLGDAAHPMLQYLAQGACMAIEDAVCLAENVAHSPHNLSQAFETYTQARYLRTGRVQIMARVHGEFYHAGGVRAELRDLMLGGRSVEQSYDASAWLYADAMP